ncbi:hypothetical protein BDV30DRAFT_215228 [Aspergillus minisclerotigenes]|uniref:Uncharacterized protein n=1 Tax=Aspergillus minisclerotigenes TaxID=656917 RepID=A0A5N6IWH6_9EURO|nr:hypothetical protein BDV30DRAFT_215228 [Aspergillus minisclerotigenes]
MSRTIVSFHPPMGSLISCLSHDDTRLGNRMCFPRQIKITAKKSDRSSLCNMLMQTSYNDLVWVKDGCMTRPWT